MLNFRKIEGKKHKDSNDFKTLPLLRNAERCEKLRIKLQPSRKKNFSKAQSCRASPQKNLEMLEQKREHYLFRMSECNILKEKSFVNFERTNNQMKKSIISQKKKKSIKFKSRASTIFSLIPEFSMRINEAKMKYDEETFQSYFSKSYELRKIPNYCYDSPFVIPREGPCLINFHSKLYLMGGAIKRRIGYINKQNKNTDFSFHSYENGKWVQQKIKQNVPLSCRNITYHTVDSTDKHIIIAGGVVGEFQKSMNSINSDLILYNPKTKRIKSHPVSFSIHSHASVVISQKYLVLHGGITGENKKSSDFHLINTKQLTSELTFPSTESLAYHKMVHTLDLQRHEENSLGYRGGIFLFGGMDEDGGMKPQMKIIRYPTFDIEKPSSFRFESCQTHGISPCGRIHHSMNFMKKNMSIAVVGGIDENGESLADVWLLDLYESEWVQVQMEPSLDLLTGGISRHATVSDGQRVIVYGGKHNIDQGIDNFMSLQLDCDIQEKKKCQLLSKKPRKRNKVSTYWSIVEKDEGEEESSEVIDTQDPKEAR